MKKLLPLILLFTIIGTLYAEAPELKNMMPNSWQKLTRLTVDEEKEFLEKVDIKKYYTFENYGNELIKSEKIYTQIYKEKCNDLEIYRILSSTVTIEEALLVTVIDGIYTDEKKDHFLDREAISEIDFLKEDKDYRYIASTKYGFTAGFQTGFGYEYGNIMYRAKNSKDVGVFITNAINRFVVLDGNEFVFRKCKNQVKGYAECLYYDIRDLLEGETDKYIRIESSDYLVDSKSPLKYSIQNAFDGNPATSYVENTEDDLMKIEFSGFKSKFSKKVALGIINGYALNEKYYYANNRIIGLNANSYRINDEKTELIAREPIQLILKDGIYKYQILSFDYNNRVGSFSFSTAKIIKGNSFNDTCIAEINLSETDNFVFGEINE